MRRDVVTHRHRSVVPERVIPYQPPTRARHSLVHILVALIVAGTAAASIGAGPALASPTLSQLVGQKLMVAMAGTTPSADLLGRIQRGEVGGVILFGSNVISPAQRLSPAPT
jgi:hypothetical protein